ncbi:hypothetical protein NCS52_00769400 [Fusarium sp. LHS14.1]|nr:hypothetical protein NCS52_00769400 [Fusarium sp. LHS14.1]
MSSRSLPPSPRSGSPSTPTQLMIRATSNFPWIQQCAGLHHLHISFDCGICDKELIDGSFCMILYSKNFPRGPWKSVSARFRLAQGHRLWQGDGLCFCGFGFGRSLPPGAALVHLNCFYLFFLRSHTPLAVFHYRRDRLATALTFRRFDSAPFNRHYKIRFPRQVPFDAFLHTARQFGFSRIDSLPNEILSMIIEFYEGSPFLHAVQVMATSLELRAFTPHCVSFYLPEVVSWKRGDAVPVLAPRQSPLPGPLRVTLDPRGICCVDRETGGSPSHSRRFVRIRDGRRVRLYFKDGLAYLRRPEGYPWFRIEGPPLRDTSRVSQAHLPPPVDNDGHPAVPTQAPPP